MKLKHSWKRALLLVCLLGFSAFRAEDEENDEQPLSGKGFCGKITYALQVESKCPQVSSRQLQERYGNTMTLYIKDGAYKMVYSGREVKELVYLGELNQEFVLMDQMDSLMWMTGEPMEQCKCRQYRTFMQRDQCHVLDRSCDAFCLVTPWSNSTYLFDPSMRLSHARDFKDNGPDYFNVYLRRAKAPFLKSVYDGVTVKRTLIATEVEEMPLDDALFDKSGTATSSM